IGCCERCASDHLARRVRPSHLPIGPVSVENCRNSIRFFELRMRFSFASARGSEKSSEEAKGDPSPGINFFGFFELRFFVSWIKSPLLLPRNQLVQPYKI